MKIPTCLLIGRPLDWAAELAERTRLGFPVETLATGEIVLFGRIPHYTTDWAAAGVLLNAYPQMQLWYSSLEKDEEPHCAVMHVVALNGQPLSTHLGRTKLIALARCVVAHVLGEEVDVPDKFSR